MHKFLNYSVNLAGYLIPKGWKVLTWFRDVHMDPEVFPDPRKFDPSRWDVSQFSHLVLFDPKEGKTNVVWFCLSIRRGLYQKLVRSFLLVLEAIYAQEMISLSSRFLFSFTISSSNIGKSCRVLEKKCNLFLCYVEKYSWRFILRRVKRSNTECQVMYLPHTRPTDNCLARISYQ